MIFLHIHSMYLSIFLHEYVAAPLHMWTLLSLSLSCFCQPCSYTSHHTEQILHTIDLLNGIFCNKKKTLTKRRRTNHKDVVNARLATLSGLAQHRLGHTGHPTFKVKSTRRFIPPSGKRFDCDHTPRIRYCDVVQKCHHRDELQQGKGMYVLFAS